MRKLRFTSTTERSAAAMPTKTGNSLRLVWGFTLIELLITIAIVAILGTVVALAVAPSIKKARDARRKNDISQIGRLIVSRCYVPNAGGGDYDLLPVLDELKAKYPQYAAALTQIPQDPSRGNASTSFYRYAVNASTSQCALYANLENEAENVTLPGVLAPGPGNGTGVLQASTTGWNGSTKYFQFGN